MSFWGRIFGAPEVITKSVDAVINAGDALVFTEEERSKANMERLNWILQFHEASKGSNVARRLIAVMFTFVFLALTAATAVLAGFGLGDQAAAVFKVVTDALVVPMGLIISFYFAAGMVRDYTGTKK